MSESTLVQAYTSRGATVLAVDSMALGQIAEARAAGGTVRMGAVGVVDVGGPLSQRAWFFGDGYDAIEARFEAAMADPDLDSVVLRIDSPGGEVAGLEEAVARMQGKKTKPVVAYVDEFAASAAYWIAAAVADEIVVPPSGEVGSIGVIAAWLDMSEALEGQGVKVHVHRSPDGKAPGMPMAPVEDVANERMAEGVAQAADRFVAAMSKARGLDKKTIRGFDAATFGGKKAVEVGLADRVGSLDTAIKAAGTAARKKKMANDLRSTLGLDAEATDEQLLAKAAELAAAAAQLPQALADLAAKTEALEAAEQRAVEQRLAVEERERKALCAKLVTDAGFRPVHVWADALAEELEPGPAFAGMPVDDLRAYVERAVAEPMAERAEERGDEEPDLGEHNLNEREVARCEEIAAKYGRPVHEVMSVLADEKRSAQARQGDMER